MSNKPQIKNAKVNTGALNVRKKPTEESDVVTILRRGTVIKVTSGAPKGWYRLLLSNGMSGYSRKEFIEVTE